MLRLTPVVKNLILINIIVFIGQQIIPDLTEYIGLFDVRTPYFKPYQLFTYMFAHGGFSHILWNMLFLFFAGPALEEFWGQKKFLFFYMASGLGAGVFYMVIQLFIQESAHISIMYGASGAVYGVLTAFGVIFAEMNVRLFFVLNVKAKYVVLFLGTMAIINSVGPFRASGDGVAHLAHLGGIVIALILLMYWRSKGRY